MSNPVMTENVQKVKKFLKTWVIVDVKKLINADMSPKVSQLEIPTKIFIHQHMYPILRTILQSIEQKYFQ